MIFSDKHTFEQLSEVSVPLYVHEWHISALLQPPGSTFIRSRPLQAISHFLPPKTRTLVLHSNVPILSAPLPYQQRCITFCPHWPPEELAVKGERISPPTSRDIKSNRFVLFKRRSTQRLWHLFLCLYRPDGQFSESWNGLCFFSQATIDINGFPMVLPPLYNII